MAPHRTRPTVACHTVARDDCPARASHRPSSCSSALLQKLCKETGQTSLRLGAALAWKQWPEISCRVCGAVAAGAGAPAGATGADRSQRQGQHVHLLGIRARPRRAPRPFQPCRLQAWRQSGDRIVHDRLNSPWGHVPRRACAAGLRLRGAPAARRCNPYLRISRPRRAPRPFQPCSLRLRGAPVVCRCIPYLRISRPRRAPRPFQPCSLRLRGAPAVRRCIPYLRISSLEAPLPVA